MATLCILTPDRGYEAFLPTAMAEFTALLGDSVTFRRWSDAGDLSGFRLTLPLLAWGYQSLADRWMDALAAWESAGIPMANPIPILRWNTDKHYLFDLEAKAVPIIPTLASAALSDADISAGRARFGDAIIVKPPISGGADGTYRLDRADSLPEDVRGRPMLIQPLMPAIASEGEYSLFFFGGAFSHAILKVPAAGDFRVQEQFGGREIAVAAPEGTEAVAEAALAAARQMDTDEILYARVDLVRGEDGGFRLMELELIEPGLFLSHAPDRGKRLGDALAKACAS